MLTVSPMTTSGTKCYLYFDEYTSSIKDTLLSYYPTVLTRTDFSTTVTNTTTGVIYKSANSSQYDNDGEVYYFAGNPIDNWIYFGGFYWRIIRFNGNGTVRLIYAGNSTTGSGEDDQIRISSFNNSSNMSYYVGLSYDGTQHGIGTESTILIELNNWYNSSESGNLGTNYGNYIDNNTGFCSDRNMSSGSGWSIQPSREIRYAAYERLVTNKNPSLGCSNNDILNIPIGLITADEMAYAGGTTTSENQNYYLSTGQEYWTMTPSLAYNSGTAVNFWAGSSGWVFNFGTTVAYSRGIRPVINLRSDVTISSGNGTASHPFVINTD